MDSAGFDAFLDFVGEVGGGLDSVSVDAVTFGVFFEIGVAKIHAEIGESGGFLLPFYHSERVVVQNYDDQVEFEASGSFEFLGIHHESAVATDCDDGAFGVDEFCGDGGGKSGAHRGERVVEEEVVGAEGAEVACEEDFVHAVVEGDDRVFDFFDFGDKSLRAEGEIVGFGGFFDVIFEKISHFEKILKIPILWLDAVGELPERVCDVADDFKLRKIHFVNPCGEKIDVDDFCAVFFHQKWRFFDRVVSDVENQVCASDRTVEVVVV